jgi:hypothetical protein
MLFVQSLQSKQKRQQQTSAQQEQQVVTAANSDVDDTDAAATTTKHSTSSELDHTVGADASDYDIGKDFYFHVVFDMCMLWETDSQLHTYAATTSVPVTLYTVRL